MEEINGINLKDVFTEASEQIFNEKKASVIAKIKKLAFKIEALESDIKKNKAAINKKSSQLEGALKLAERIKSGDWSVLVDDSNNDNNKSEE